jgi:hypothetical protein
MIAAHYSWGHYWPTVPALDVDGECGAVGGMIRKGNWSTRKNLPQYHFVHHKFYMTWPGLLRWEAGI